MALIKNYFTAEIPLKLEKKFDWQAARILEYRGKNNFNNLNL